VAVVKVSMFRAFLLFTFALLFSMNSYAALLSEKPPEWLAQKLNGHEFRKLTADGKKFYIIISSCCDQSNPVFDENGKQVCSLGGIKGRGDGKCPKFEAEK